MKTTIQDIYVADGGLTYVDKSVDVSNFKSTNLDDATNRSKSAADYLNDNWGDGEDGYATWRTQAEGLWYDIMSDSDGIYAVAGDKSGIVYYEAVNVVVVANNQYFDLSMLAGDIVLDKDGEIEYAAYTPDLNAVVVEYASKLLNDEQLELVNELGDFAIKVRNNLSDYAKRCNGTDTWLEEIERGLECQGLPSPNVAVDYRDIDRADDLKLYDKPADEEAIKAKISEVLDRIEKYLKTIDKKYENY